MARDPAEVLDRLIDSALDAALDDADYIENHQPGGADLLKALDAAGYEVRPKAEEGVVTLKGKPWRVATLAEAFGREDVIAPPLLPVTDGDDPTP